MVGAFEPPVVFRVINQSSHTCERDVEILLQVNIDMLEGAEKLLAQLVGYLDLWGGLLFCGLD